MKKSYTKLENWAVMGGNDPWQAPEMQRVFLVGSVYNHPNPDRHPDGKEIRTSYLVEAKGRIIKTVSGSIYKLGRVDPKYREFLKEIRPDWDWRNPIRMVEK